MGRVTRRPLRMEELRDGERYWLEDKGQGILGGRIREAGDKWQLVFPVISGELTISREKERYGKAWRCWEHEATHQERLQFNWEE